MRRLATLPNSHGLFVWSALLLGFVLVSSPRGASAQPPEEEEEPLEEEPLEEGDDPDGESPQLRPPTMEPIDLQGEEGEDPVEEEPLEEEPLEEEPLEEPSPGAAEAELERSAPPAADPTTADWVGPQPVLTLHGYFRVRGELQDTFWLGRGGSAPERINDPPFSDFRPIDNSALPSGGCGDSPEGGMATSRCDTETLSFANMRLRLEPTLALSDDVRVHFMLDVFDNLVLGSTPESNTYIPTGTGFERSPRVPYTPTDSFSFGQHPPSGFRNSIQDSIVARRAWAEVTNRTLGMIRFGRMGSHWGLGMMQNDGRGIDGDYSTDVDRVMGITKLAGFYFIAAYDFANEGYIQQFANDIPRVPYDAGQKDDVDQIVFSVARRLDDEEIREALDRDEVVVNGGLYFMYRTQTLSSQGAVDPFGAPGSASSSLVRRNAEAFIPDLWGQLRWRSLRVEAEAVLVGGSIESTREPFELQNYGILQFGGALESEYRLLEDKLAFRFNAGFASGDSNVYGLANVGGDLDQLDNDDQVSTFRFHPNYRVDLILWRTILRQVSGAYYLRPGVSYDFIRNEFGQLFGASADFVWSRASQPVQAWGSDPDLGVEIDLALYYRSEDGPDLLDGFFASVMYGVLFPMKGLGYLDGEDGSDLSTAQTLRLVLGVQY